MKRKTLTAAREKRSPTFCSSLSCDTRWVNGQPKSKNIRLRDEVRKKRFFVCFLAFASYPPAKAEEWMYNKKMPVGLDVRGEKIRSNWDRTLDKALPPFSPFHLLVLCIGLDSCCTRAFNAPVLILTWASHFIFFYHYPLVYRPLENHLTVNGAKKKEKDSSDK